MGRSEARAESRFAETRGVHFRVLFDGPVDQMLARRAVEISRRRIYGSATPSGSIQHSGRGGALHHAAVSRYHPRPGMGQRHVRWRIRVPVKGALEQVGELERVLAHEYVHALIAGVASRGVPAWVNEGLAVVHERGGLAIAERIVASSRNRRSSSSCMPASAAAGRNGSHGLRGERRRCPRDAGPARTVGRTDAPPRCGCRCAVSDDVPSAHRDAVRKVPGRGARR